MEKSSYLEKKREKKTKVIRQMIRVQPGKKILRKRGACDETYLVSVRANEKKVEGYGRHQVDDEPTLQVMDGYLCRMGHHFIVAIHESRAKIYDDVHYESDVDWNTKSLVKTTTIYARRKKKITTNKISKRIDYRLPSIKTDRLIKLS